MEEALGVLLARFRWACRRVSVRDLGALLARFRWTQSRGCSENEGFPAMQVHVRDFKISNLEV